MQRSRRPRKKGGHCVQPTSLVQLGLQEERRRRELDEDTGSSVRNKRPVQIIEEEEEEEVERGKDEKATERYNRRQGARRVREGKEQRGLIGILRTET